MKESNQEMAQIKDLITKFFYQQNQLCFQILLHLQNNKTVFYKEFTDYELYRKSFSQLQQVVAKKLTLKASDKSLDLAHSA